jgi:hypothetical protein
MHGTPLSRTERRTRRTYARGSLRARTLEYGLTWNRTTRRWSHESRLGTS